MDPKLNLFDRIRAWSDACKLTDALAEFGVVVEECGELDDAVTSKNDAGIKDGHGDVVVTLIVLDYIKNGGKLEEAPYQPFTEGDISFTSVLGKIAEGLRKPKKADQVRRGCRILLREVQRRCYNEHDHLFVRDCLEPVVAELERRLAEGYTHVNGTVVKKGDA